MIDKKQAIDFGTLSTFGMKEPPPAPVSSVSDFGTLSTFGMKEQGNG